MYGGFPRKRPHRQKETKRFLAYRHCTGCNLDFAGKARRHGRLATFASERFLLCWTHHHLPVLMSTSREKIASCANCMIAADTFPSGPPCPLLVGIGGATNAGKSSLARHLIKVYPWSSLVCLDDYFWPEEHANHVWVDLHGESKTRRRHQNWDCPSAFNWNKLRCDILSKISELSALKPIACRQRRPLLVIEGILIFAEPMIENLIDKQFFITLPYDVCRQRRSRRHYEPPDPEGYFEQVVWPEYEKHLEYIRSVQLHGDGVESSKTESNTNEAEVHESKTHAVNDAALCPAKLLLDGTKVQREILETVVDFLDPLLL